MTIKIFQDKIQIGDYVLQETPTGFSVNGFFEASSYTGAQLSTGYTSGGYQSVPVSLTTIYSYPFSTPITVATQGNLSAVRNTHAGHSSTTDGFVAGGRSSPSTYYNTVDTFPFATTPASATNIGTLTQTRAWVASQSSPTRGYVSGGYGPPTPSNFNRIDSFPFSTSPITSTNNGNLSQSRAFVVGQVSSTDGYTSGGNITGAVNTIDRFPFSTPFTTATDVGDLSISRFAAYGQFSSTEGYTSGGLTPAYNTIDRFPFSTPFTTATDAGDLSAAKGYGSSNSSPTEGYAVAGAPPQPVHGNTIEKFPFSTPFTTATDVGDLPVVMTMCAPHQK
jgi:hypothetical protein